MLIHEYLRWKTIDAKILEKTYNEQLANAILRNYGQERFEAYNAMFVPEIEDNLPKLQLFEGCTEELQEVIPSCQYEQKEHKNSEDVAEFKGDDLYDALRGLLEVVDEYVREAKDEFTTRQVIDKVVRNLHESGDHTQFYRQMEIVEAVNAKKGFGVRRFHRKRFH
jgi:hypothetical protein